MIANTGPGEQGEIESLALQGTILRSTMLRGIRDRAHVHDVQFVGKQIKLIGVYARSSAE